MGIVLGFLGLALFYLSVTPAKYTAETVVLLDKGITNTISNVSSLNLTTYEPAAIDSEVQVLKSKRITDAVVKLLESKEYFNDIPLGADRRDFILFKVIQANLAVTRIEKTYALSIKFKSKNPQKSADVANAFAEVYIADQLDSLAETSQRTLSWLQTKAEEIKIQSKDARQRLAEYRSKYNAEAQKNINNKNKDVRLREFRDLEQEIETFDTIYESYLEKVRTISLEQSFPVTETRIITYATAPITKSEPKSVIILGAAIILGAGLGILIALILDFFDKTLRRAGQVKRELEMGFLGFLPKIRKSSRRKVNFVSPDNKALDIRLYTQSADDGRSLCAETIRTAKNVLDFETDTSQNKVIGVLSTFADKDTFVISSNLAVHCAQEGKRSLLINGDLQSIKTSDSKDKPFYSPEDAQDFLLENICYSEQYNLHILDAQSVSQNKEGKFNAQGINALLDVCRNQYDYTVVDLPPLHATSSLYTYMQSIDNFILVAEWGKTLPNTLNFYLQQNRLDRDKIAGVILSKTNMKKMRSHYGHIAYIHSKR